MTRLTTTLWQEVPEPTDPFAVRTARCAGYDVYGELLGRASYPELLLLLFTGERPTAPAAALLNDLAVVLANPGPRDPSVHAAMCAGVGHSPAASALTAALAAGAGQGGGARDVLLAMSAIQDRGTDLAAWELALASEPPAEPDDVWPVMEHPPGFAPHAGPRPGIVQDALARLAERAPEAGMLRFLASHADALEAAAGRPLAMSGVAAAALHDLGLPPQTGEMLTLLLRLPGAAAHALEQQARGFKSFPFGAVDLLNDPAERLAAIATTTEEPA